MKQIKVINIQAVYHIADKSQWKFKWSIYKDPWDEEPKEDHLGKELIFCIEHDDWSKLFYREKDVTIPYSEYEELLTGNK